MTSLAFAKAPEDEPRDEHGRWVGGSGGGKIVGASSPAEVLSTLAQKETPSYYGQQHIALANLPSGGKLLSISSRVAGRQIVRSHERRTYTHIEPGKQYGKTVPRQRALDILAEEFKHPNLHKGADMTELTILTKVPEGAEVREMTVEEIARGLRISPEQVEALLEPVAKNLTVGDVHVSTALGNISTAYLQEDDDGSEQEEDDEERERREAEDARKINENHDEHGRFAEGDGSKDNHSGVAAHVDALHAAGMDRPAFEQAHAALAADKSMKLSDLKRVASRYMGGHIHSSKDNRKDVLDQLERTFTQNARFNNKIKRLAKALDMPEEHVRAVLKFDEDEPRDEHGMWTSGGGGGGNFGDRGQTTFRQGIEAAHSETKAALQKVSEVAQHHIGQLEQTYFRHVGKRVRKGSDDQPRDEQGRWTSISSGEAQDHADFLSKASDKLSELQSEMEEHQADLESHEELDDEIGQEHGYDSKEYKEFERKSEELGTKAAQSAEKVHQHLKEMLATHKEMMRSQLLHKRLPVPPRDDVRIEFAVRKADPDQRKVFGWASVSALDGKLVVDKQDDIILIHDLEKAAHDFTLYSRTQGDMHTDIGVGRMIESIIFDQAKRDAGVIAKDADGRVIDGWWVGFQVDDQDVWDAHKRGDRLEFSIGGRAQRESFEKASEDEPRDEQGRWTSGGGGDHGAALEAGLGHPEAFKNAMDKLSADKSLSHEQLVGVAREFGVHATNSMSRSKVLSNISERHEKLMRFKQTHVGPAA